MTNFRLRTPTTHVTSVSDIGFRIMQCAIELHFTRLSKTASLMITTRWLVAKEAPWRILSPNRYICMYPAVLGYASSLFLSHIHAICTRTILK